MNQKVTTRNQSIEKALRIIEIMAENKDPLRLLDISEKAGYPQSTVLRMLSTLDDLGYVEQDAASLRYFLSFKLCKIGNQVRAQFNIVNVAHPYLVQLSNICRESSCLAIESDMSVAYVDTVEGPDSMLKTMQYIGRLAPMHNTGVGKLLLLNYDEEKLKLLTELKGLPKFTEHTITTYEGLINELEIVKKQGYAFDNEECELGARCIAAPLTDYKGSIIGAISVSGPINRLQGENLDFVIQSVLDISKKISAKLN